MCGNNMRTQIITRNSIPQKISIYIQHSLNEGMSQNIEIGVVTANVADCNLLQ
jgi:hypothetical protein